MFHFEKLKPEEVAWLAGLFQAEAQFYIDHRKRSKVADPNYVPPPPVPAVKIEMVEKDLMERVAEWLGQKVAVQNRKTTAGNTVYRVNLTARQKVKVFLETILPYVYGEKKRGEIQELLDICDEYDNWLAAGGRSQAARHAARMKAQRDKE